MTRLTFFVRLCWTRAGSITLTPRPVKRIENCDAASYQGVGTRGFGVAFYRLAAMVGAACLLAACVTTTSTTSSEPRQDRPSGGAIVGEWNLKATDSVLSCRVRVSPGRGGGSATDFGCIGLDNFAMIRRWERGGGGGVAFYRFAYDDPVARVRRVDRNEFRGRLLPSGREIVLTRR